MIPELHDVGKLLGLEKHWFDGVVKPAYVDDKNEETWLAIRYHAKHGGMSTSDQAVFNGLRILSSSGDYPAQTRRAMVLLSLADGASASSRVLPEGGKVGVQGFAQHGAPRFCLWRDKQPPIIFEHETHGKPSDQEVQNLLKEALSTQSWQAFRKAHETEFQLTPEDKHPLRAMTSLATHCELVGRLFRLLDDIVIPDASDGKLNGKLFLGKEKAANFAEIRKNWSAYVLRSDIHIPQRPAHARDMNIFPAVQEALEAIREGTYRDHVLFTTSQALWLILLPGQEGKLSEILEPLFDLGVVTHTVERESTFKKVGFPLSNELEAAKGENHKFHSLPELPAQAGERICEVCQIREGREEQRDAESGVVEVLCDNCSQIRERDRGFQNLAEWNDGPVLWCRVSLDGQTIPGHLGNLYRYYLKSLRYDDGGEVVQDDELVNDLVGELQPAALLAEYAEDYERLIFHFWSRVESGLDSLGLDRETSLEQITRLPNGVSDLFAVNLDVPGVPDIILDAFSAAVHDLFPVSAERDDCPVRIGLSLAHAKHPFFQHWDSLKELGGVVNLFQPSRRPVRVTLKDLARLRELAGEMGSTYLHNLAEIERRTGSRLMAEVKLISDRKHKPWGSGIKISDILAYSAFACAGGE